MIKNSIKTILFFSLFLALFSFRGYAAPTISYSWESSIDPATYSTEAVYRFNVTVCDDDGASEISVVLFEWNDEPNITVTENVTYNSTCLNFTTTKIDLSANESGWNYKWYANNTGDKDATPLQDNYTINKAPTETYLYIDGSRNNKTVDLNWTINFTVFTNVSGRMIELWTNYPDGSTWEMWNNSTEPLINYTKMSSGFFNFTAVFSGDVNYTKSNETFYVNITNLPPQFSNETANPSTPATYSLRGIYQFNITWQDGSLANATFNIYNTSELTGNSINITLNSILNFTGPTNITNDTIDDNTKTFSANVPDLPVGNYNYRWSAIDSLGNISSTGDLTYVINKGSILHLSVNGTESDITVDDGTQVTIVCWTNDTRIDGTQFKLERWSPQDSLENTYTNTSDYNISKNDTFFVAHTGTEFRCYVSNSSIMESYYNVSRTISVSSLSPPSDDSQPPSPGPSPGALISGAISIQGLTSKLTVNAGESKSTTFSLKNTYSSSFDVNVSISGVSSTWYRLDKTTLVRIPAGSTESITLTFSIPKDAEAKDYTITVKVSGGTSPQSSFTLTVNPPVEEEEEEELITEQPETTNVTANETADAPTGLFPFNLMDPRYIVLIVGVIACVLIVVVKFRSNVREFVSKGYKPIKEKRIEVKPKEKVIKKKEEKKRRFPLSGLKLKVTVVKEKKEKK